MSTLNIAQDILNKKKVKHSDIIYSTSNTFSLKSEKGELSEYKKSNTHVLGVRIIRDGHVGISYTEATDKGSIERTIDNAIENSKYTKLSKFEEIESDLEMHVENEEENVSFRPEVEAMINQAIALETEVLKRDKRATNAPYNGLAEYESKYEIINSAGASLSKKIKYYSAWTSALLSDAEKNATHYESTQAYDYNHLRIEDVINSSIERADKLLNAGQIKTGKHSVMFDHDILESLFHAYSVMYSAKSVIHKESPFAQKLGQKVISDQLTLTDSPGYAEAFMKSHFDSEGFKKQDNAIFEKGILKQFLHNSATAKELGMKNNFCASRGAKSPLSLSTSNLVIATGKDSEEELNSKTFIEILDVTGLRSGVNVISGQFSAGVSGRIWKNGEIVRYFKDSTISANFFDMLKEVEYVGNETLSNKSRSFFTPKIIFPEIQLAGK